MQMERAHEALYDPFRARRAAQTLGDERDFSRLATPTRVVERRAQAGTSRER